MSIFKGPHNNDAWLASFGTPQRPRGIDGHHLWPGPTGWLISSVRVPRRADYVLVCPKSSPLDWWWSVSPPRGVAAMYSPYPADPRLAPMLRALCASGAPAVFLGDMDPVSVAQYLAAKRMLRARNGPPLLYGGINDSWLAAIPRSLKGRATAAALRIPLAKPEKRLWRQLEGAIDTDHLLGAEACGLLRSGYKVELEAASNPAIYNPGHQRWVFRYLRSVALGKARDHG